MNECLFLNSAEVHSLLAGAEEEIFKHVRSAYLLHHCRQSILPNSTFLPLPNPANRIIALPGWLGGQYNCAGLKWIASFPENVSRGFPRATAIIVLNDIDTGRPYLIVEGAVISAARTGASAALAAQAMVEVLGMDPQSVGLIGCGVINAEVLRFTRRLFPAIDTIFLADKEEERAKLFIEKHIANSSAIRSIRISEVEGILRDAAIVSFATTASTPYVDSLPKRKPGALILNISLRDLSPRVILGAQNIVDDVDHVCRAGTSIELAFKEHGTLSFISGTLAELLTGAPRRAYSNEVSTVFSPFGLGVLDLAMANFVCSKAKAMGVGLTLML